MPRDPREVGSPATLQYPVCMCPQQIPLSLRSKALLSVSLSKHSRAPGAGEEAGLCPPAHRSLAGSSWWPGQPPHHSRDHCWPLLQEQPLLIKLKRPHASTPQDLPIKLFWCGSKLKHSYLVGTFEALTSQQLKGFWLAPFPLKHACWL